MYLKWLFFSIVNTNTQTNTHTQQSSCSRRTRFLCFSRLFFRSMYKHFLLLLFIIIFFLIIQIKSWNYLAKKNTSKMKRKKHWKKNWVLFSLYGKTQQKKKSKKIDCTTRVEKKSMCLSCHLALFLEPHTSRAKHGNSEFVVKAKVIVIYEAYLLLCSTKN